MTRSARFLLAVVSGAALAASNGCGGGGTSTNHGGSSTGGAGSVTTTSSGTGLKCATPSDCPDTGNECVLRICLESGQCGTVDAAEGLAVSTQALGDCKKLVCDGNGGTQSVNDDSDVPDDGEACTADSCSMGSPVHAPIAGPCAENGGVVCGAPSGSAGGTCVECNVGSDCTSGVCSGNACVPATCADGVKNGTETDVDCGGGTCGPCPDGLPCILGTDCKDLVCDPTSKTCSAPTCADGQKNGSETDVDCGATCGSADLCATAQKCKTGADCQSHVCDGALLVCNAASCLDGVRNGTETDLDCGGTDCDAAGATCALGKGCLVSADCASTFCHPTSKTCVLPTCMDGFQNENETDVDCGGPTCGGTCANGKTCLASVDCTSRFCSGGTCAACSTDAQCGPDFFCGAGTCTAVKPNGAPCAGSAQCSSAFCVDAVCCESACGGLCQACTSAKKGTGADGVCGPVLAATDPDNECTDQGAASCGTDGVCDGAGACRKYASGTVCTAASCSGGSQTTAATCNGTGSCAAGTTSSCGGYACGATSCKTTCSVNTDCAPGFVCGGSGTCVASPTSCRAIHAASPALPDGVYTLDPDGPGGVPAFSAYCDMTTLGGGWTLIVHSWLSGTYPPDPAFTQTFAQWQTNGVGTASGYGGPTSSTFYVMPLEPMRVVITSTASSLRFQSDSFVTTSQLDGLTMNANYGFGGTNLAQVQTDMCTSQAATNCFLRAPGFSSFDVHHDSMGGACGTGVFAYGNVGYWYDDCYSTNVFATGGTYGGPTWYSSYSKDASTKHWTWWVR